MRYVIVGAGPAGVIAAETLRAVDADSDVVLIGGEPEPPYSRMALPYVLAGQIDEPGTYLRKAPKHYEDLGIRTVQGSVDKVSADGTVTLAGGDTHSFDRLLVATGATPVKPPVPGLDLPGVHHCWTMEDARHIAKLATKGADVVLIGAGFIGCIILQSLVERGVKLSVVEMEDRMLPLMMDHTGGAIIKRWCEDRGVTVLTSAQVTGVEKSGDGLAVSLSEGGPLKATLVVVATGVKSNVAFLEGSGVEIGVGVKVDNRLRSSVETIYAAGDVAEGPDFSTGGWLVHPIQPTAADHGRIAALNMAGLDAAYKGSLIMNVLDTLGLVSCSFGHWQDDTGEAARVVDEAGSRCMHLTFKDDRIVGALSLGRTDHMGVLRGLIQGRVALGAWKEKLIADPHRIMDAYVALRA